MSGKEEFLSRWSRRKRAAEAPVQTPPLPEAASSDLPTAADAANNADAEKSKDQDFDLASLPSLDSISAGTDVSVFLRKGVPLDLTRAALRRAWSADPAIRDFIGLAENAWDFNDPNAMPGFGPLDQSPEQVRQMLAQVMGEIRRTAEPATAPPDDSPARLESTKDYSALAETNDAHTPSADISASDDEPASAETSASPDAGTRNAAVHDIDDDAADEDVVVRRTHGGALPR